MKQGLALLTSRSIDDELDIESLEKEYQIQIPPIFRIFSASYALQEEGLYADRVMVGNGSEVFLNYFVYEPNPDIMFAGFNDLKFALSIMEDDEIWENNGYIPIGACGFNGAILLGTKNGEEDKIILLDYDDDSSLTVIAYDIFQFVRGLQLVLETDNIKTHQIDLKKLYKKWDETIWRIAE